MKVHFSIDDVFGSLRWLTRNKCKSDELYKSTTFEFVNSLHEKYDAEVTLYCLCQDDGFTLRDVPDTWRDEFVRNSDWLKFGFHCNDYDSNYNSCSVEEFKYQYDEFVNQYIFIQKLQRKRTREEMNTQEKNVCGIVIKVIEYKTMIISLK